MTPKEAIEYLNIMKLSTEDDSVGEIKKEVCDIAIEALEKQEKKKPVAGACPCCKRLLDIFKECPVCECGQAIDWSEEE